MNGGACTGTASCRLAREAGRALTCTCRNMTYRCQ
jgi:hypothetical protein